MPIALFLTRIRCSNSRNSFRVSVVETYFIYSKRSYYVLGTLVVDCVTRMELCGRRMSGEMLSAGFLGTTFKHRVFTSNCHEELFFGYPVYGRDSFERMVSEEGHVFEKKQVRY